MRFSKTEIPEKEIYYKNKMMPQLRTLLNFQSMPITSEEILSFSRRN